MPTGLFVGTVVLAFGQALAFPALMTLAVNGAPASERSSVVGTFTAFTELGFAVGALSLGAIASALGYDGVFIVCAIGPLVGALLLARIAGPRVVALPDAACIGLMERRELGRSGISVTRIILGCGNFGGVGSAPAFFGQGIPHDEAPRIMDAAWELGITTFDTADAYGGGRSETWIGEWLATKGSAVRDAIVVETKTFNPMDEGEDRGLSRHRIRRQIETSLDAPRPRAHPAVHGACPRRGHTASRRRCLRSTSSCGPGKVGAVGASNFTAEQLAEAVETSELEGLTRYEWVQNSFSLLEQDDAETVFPVCHEHGLGYEVHGPIAGGWLAGRYRRGEEYPAGSRMTQRPEGYRRYETDAMFDALEAFEREAFGRGVSMAGLALAWLLGVPEVIAVVVGPTRAEQLEPVREALALELSAEEHAHLGGLFS